MRLFIAIELPKELESQIDELKKKLKTEHANTTITKDNHLTLKFLGDVKESDLNNLKEQLNKVEFKQHKVKLDTAGVFPNESEIRVVWIGIKPEEQTINLKNKIDGSLKDFKFKDDFEFHPHMTLARVKLVKDKIKFKEVIQSLIIPNSEFEIKEFKLIKSELTSEGPVYEIIEEFKLH